MSELGQSRRFGNFGAMSAYPLMATERTRRDVRSVPILLQKSKVAGQRFFRENTKWDAIDDSYNLNRVTEVACEFCARR
jgi:hypothetical protein